MIEKNQQDPAQTSEQISNCRALDLGMGIFAECLQGGPNSCAYALPFGYAFLCRHPRLREILQNTSKPANDLNMA